MAPKGSRFSLSIRDPISPYSRKARLTADTPGRCA